jgi:putative isomerase
MDENEKYEALLRSYIKGQISNVLKQPNQTLKHPFIDPGSVYDGNLWDWDSFWAAYSLFSFGEESEELKEKLIKHAKGNIYNFMDYQMADGYIPMMINSSVDEPEPHLIQKHREGVIMNMCKPFLCQQINLISGFCGDYLWVGDFYDNLLKYFSCYEKYYYNQNCGLYVWADDIMIGMDNDPATFGRPRYSTANMFLNSFLVREFKAMALIAEKLGKSDDASLYLDKVETLQKEIQDECWDSRDKFFYSADVDIKTRKFDRFHQGLGVFWKTLPIKIRTWTGFIPLWASFASEEQAEWIVKEHILDTSTFNSPFGIRALSKDEKMYNCTPTINPSNWLGPIWIVANYIVFRGLMNYGYRKEAEELYHKILLLLGRDLEKTGTLHEFYVPETGEPVMNGGFLNWNILVINMADELKGKESFDRFLC